MFVKKAFLINFFKGVLFVLLSLIYRGFKDWNLRGFYYYYYSNKTTCKIIFIDCLCFAVKEGNKRAASVFFLAAQQETNPSALY